MILINRVKPHPSFNGKVESGISKMAVIGLGKQKGAAFCHARGIICMSETVQGGVSSWMYRNGNILGAVGVV